MNKLKKNNDDGNKEKPANEEQIKRVKTLADLIGKNDVNNEYRRMVDIIADFNNENNFFINDRITFPKTINWFDNSSIDKQLALEQEINDLKKKLRTSFNELNQVTFDKENKIEELRTLKEELQSKEKINHILPRICEEARQKLLTDVEFRNKFQDRKSVV